MDSVQCHIKVRGKRKMNKKINKIMMQFLSFKNIVKVFL
jgi:hypothetical protein